jgi:hypothetical protein
MAKKTGRISVPRAPYSGRSGRPEIELLILIGLLVLLAQGCGNEDRAEDGSISSSKDAVVTGQTGTVSGTVVCNAMVKIPNVTVAIGTISSQTDIMGSYKLEKVPVGKQTITATGSQAHHDYTGQIDVTAGANTHAITMDLK